MTGPLRLLILVVGFLSLYFTLLAMFLTMPAPWFWLSGMWGSLGLYFTIFGYGGVKGWWKNAR